MRSFFFAVPLLILLHKQIVVVVTAEEQDDDDGALFISKVDRTQRDQHGTPMDELNPFDFAQQTRHYSSKSSKLQQQQQHYEDTADNYASLGKSKSSKSKEMYYVGKLKFGYGSSKSTKVHAAIITTSAATAAAPATASRETLRPTSKPTLLPHNNIMIPKQPQPVPNQYYYHSNPQYYYNNSKSGKDSKSKSGKSDSKSGKATQQYYYNNSWVRPVASPPPPKTTTTTATTSSTTSRTTAAATTTTVAATTTATDVETTTPQSTSTSEAATTTTTSSASSTITTSSEEISTTVEATITTSSTTTSSSYQCFSERNELLAAIDRYIQGGCGTTEGAKEYFICKGDIATYGWPIGQWCIGPTIDSLSRVFVNRDTFNEDISGWQVGNVTDMWGMFLGATAFDHDLSMWDISAVTDMTSMFAGASSFHQDLCAWGDKQFPYENAEDIFLNTNCTYVSDPELEEGGPFCASSCGAVVVDGTMPTTTTDATEISTTTTMTVPDSTTTTFTTTTTSTIPDTTTTSTEAVSSTEIPSASPSAMSSMEPSTQPSEFPSIDPTDVQDVTTSTSTTLPETTTSIETTTSVITTTTSDATPSSSTTVSARDETTTSSSATDTASSTSSTSLATSTEATEEATTTTATDVTSSSTTVSSVESTTTTSEGETDSQPPLKITLTYDISNKCGLDAEKAMNEVDNTLKEGLIAATTTVLQQTLNEEATIRVVVDGTLNIRRRIPPGVRGSVLTPQRYKMNLPDSDRRALATYSDEYPVTIDRILDVEQSCDPGTNCLLIISSISVVLEEGDDPDQVKDAVTESILDSFEDGRFNDAVPADTVVCPMEEMSGMMIRAQDGNP